LLKPYVAAGGLPLTLRYQRSGAGCELLLGDDWRVAPSDALQGTLAESFGSGAAVIEY
jgi:DNA polymerase III subunit alpha